MSVHQTIRDGRDRLKLTEQQFADKLDVSRGTVQQWENGKTAPNRKRQASVAALLGISVAELMGYTAPEQPSFSRKLTTAPTSIERPAMTFDEAVKAIAKRLLEVDEATRRRVMAVLADLAGEPDDYERIAQAAQAVCSTGKRRAA